MSVPHQVLRQPPSNMQSQISVGGHNNSSKFFNPMYFDAHANQSGHSVPSIGSGIRLSSNTSAVNSALSSMVGPSQYHSHPGAGTPYVAHAPYPGGAQGAPQYPSQFTYQKPHERQTQPQPQHQQNPRQQQQYHFQPQLQPPSSKPLQPLEGHQRHEGHERYFQPHRGAAKQHAVQYPQSPQSPQHSPLQVHSVHLNVPNITATPTLIAPQLQPHGARQPQRVVVGSHAPHTANRQPKASTMRPSTSGPLSKPVAPSMLSTDRLNSPPWVANSPGAPKRSWGLSTNTASEQEHTPTIRALHPQTLRWWCVKLNRVRPSAAVLNSDDLTLCLDSLLPYGCRNGNQCPRLHVASVEYLWEAIEAVVTTDSDVQRYTNGFTISCYDSCLSKYVKIPSNYIYPTAGSSAYIAMYNEQGVNFKAKFKLCPSITNEGVCTQGYACNDIHCMLESTHGLMGQQTHSANSTNAVGYPRMPAEVMVRVYNKNSASTFHDYPGSSVLMTLGAKQYMDAYVYNLPNVPKRRMQHCAHFRTKGLCRLGEGCNFIHVMFSGDAANAGAEVSVDGAAVSINVAVSNVHHKDAPAAVTRSENAIGRTSFDSAKQEASAMVVQVPGGPESLLHDGQVALEVLTPLLFLTSPGKLALVEESKAESDVAPGHSAEAVRGHTPSFTPSHLQPAAGS